MRMKKTMDIYQMKQALSQNDDDDDDYFDFDDDRYEIEESDWDSLQEYLEAF